MWSIMGEFQYVLEENGTIIGFFDISNPREQYAPFEVCGLYLRKAYQGKGYGKAVMQFIKNKIHQSFYLWCLSTNPTCGFYKHMGGKEIASKEEMIGERQETEVCFLFENN